MRVTGAEILIEVLRVAGVDTVFGLPGFQLDPVFGALGRQDRIRLVTVRHEQAASYMADGYARASGRLGVCLVVPGPGLLNAMSGLATAYACNSRVLCIAGQVPSDAIDRGLGMVHEIRGQLEMARSVVKWSGRAMSVDEVAPRACEALARIDDGRPGPVVLEVPLDVLGATTQEMPAFRMPAKVTPQPDAELVEQAAALLATADRPLVMAGGGVLAGAAWEQLEVLAGALKAPVVMTMNGKGALPAGHPLAFEGQSIDELFAAADVVLAVGTRFAHHLGERRRLNAGQKLVRLDIDPDELGRDVEPDVAIACDAKEGLVLVAESVARRPIRSAWSGLDRIESEAAKCAQSIQPQALYGSVIRDELPDDAIVVAGMTQVGYWMRIGYPVHEPRTWLTPGYQATLGFELPTGLGAQVARPDRRVVVVAGDGGFMFNVQELATAVQYGIPAITLLFNDGAYGNVRRALRSRYGEGTPGSELRNPDFGQLARAFGVLSLRAASPEALRRHLRTALNDGRPTVIEVPVGEMANPWPVLLRT